MTAAPSGPMARIRKRLAVSLTAVAAGIAISVSVDDALGGWITIFGMVSLILALHRLGRTGPE